MRRTRALALLVLCACGPTLAQAPREAPVAQRARVTPDAPFRSAPPAPEQAARFEPPPIESWTLRNGVRVMLVSQPFLRLVSVEVVSSLPPETLSSARPGARSLVAWLMRNSSPRWIRSTFVDLSGWADPDAIHVRAQLFASGLEPALDALATMVTRPNLDAAEIERQRTFRLGKSEHEREEPASLAEVAFDAAVYGDQHPYGVPVRGRGEDLRTVMLPDVVRAYEEEVQPASTTVVIVGDVDKERVEGPIAQRFEAWAARSPTSPPAGVAPTPSCAGARVLVIDRPQSTQTHIVLGGLTVPRRSPDWTSLSVLNAILGGRPSSRLVRTLRDERGFILSGRSRLAPRKEAGTFEWEAEANPSHTADTLREVDAQLRRVRSELVGADELAAAKDSFLENLPTVFETDPSTASALAFLSVYGLPTTEYASRFAAVQAVRAEDVRRVAQVLDADRMKVVIVGDWSLLRGQLVALGWGPIEVRDDAGHPVETVTPPHGG